MKEKWYYLYSLERGGGDRGGEREERERGRRGERRERREGERRRKSNRGEGPV